MSLISTKFRVIFSFTVYIKVNWVNIIPSRNKLLSELKLRLVTLFWSDDRKINSACFTTIFKFWYEGGNWKSIGFRKNKFYLTSKKILSSKMKGLPETQFGINAS